MPDIVLATLNAKYIHTAFGLRYLLANLGELRQRAVLLEFDLAQRPLEIVEQLLAHGPRIVGLGVYVWNVTPTTEVVTLLKRLRPEVQVVLGGPEVSCATDLPQLAGMANYVITGEADLKFAELCRAILKATPIEGTTNVDPAPPRMLMTPPDSRDVPLTPAFSHPMGEGAQNLGRGDGLMGSADSSTDAHPSSPVSAPAPRIIHAGYAGLADVGLPYALYSDADIAHRIVYVEASRGCPFGCEFCLSSQDVPVRQYDLDAFLAAMERLLERGVRHFKFVDRTFNLNLPACQRILEFYLARYREGLFLHFEMVPDRLPLALRELLARFPPGALQLELGIQTFNEEVARRINRPQDYVRIAENLRFLRQHTGAHLHTDLIVGLPGESLASIGDGFDQLVALGPHEIQVGLLKRLRGAPITRHDAEWGMKYSPLPPYELLESRTLTFPLLQRLRRFARYWDLIGNSGNFIETTPLLWAESGSPFASFLALSDWLFAQSGRQHGLALAGLAELVFAYLTRICRCDPASTAAILRRDYQRGGRSEDLRFLGADPNHPAATMPTARRRGSDRRQARHRAASERA